MELNYKVNVLVVEDFPTMRRTLRNLLRQIGFENIDEAENGKEALDKLKENEYVLVVSDWNMPIMEGIDFLKKVRSDKNNKIRNVAFLMVTAESEKEKILEAIKSGVDNYIIKPFTYEILKEKLEKIALKREKLRKVRVLNS